MAEIRGSPVDVGSLSHDLQGFMNLSQVVVWDFFHEQYDFWLLVAKFGLFKHLKIREVFVGREVWRPWGARVHWNGHDVYVWLEFQEIFSVEYS